MLFALALNAVEELPEDLEWEGLEVVGGQKFAGKVQSVLKL